MVKSRKQTSDSTDIGLFQSLLTRNLLFKTFLLHLNDKSQVYIYLDVGITGYCSQSVLLLSLLQFRLQTFYRLVGINVVKHIFNTALFIIKYPPMQLAQGRTQLICHTVVESPAVFPNLCLFPFPCLFVKVSCRIHLSFKESNHVIEKC